MKVGKEFFLVFYKRMRYNEKKRFSLSGENASAGQEKRFFFFIKTQGGNDYD